MRPLEGEILILGNWQSHITRWGSETWVP